MKKIKLFEEFNSKDYINRSSISPIEEVTEDTYYDMLGALPPIYVSSINGEKVSGFAVSEPSDTKKGLPTFGVYFEVEGKFYKTEATLMDKNGKPITYAMYNNMEMTRGNKATSIETKRPFVAESKKETTPSELQNKAIKILDDELSWNPHSIKVPDELDVASYDHIKNFKQDTGLIYFGMAGQSLSKNILKALNDNGIDAKVTRGFERTRQSDEHDYIIVLKESANEALIDMESPEDIQAEIDKLEKENKEGYAEDIKKLKVRLAASKLSNNKTNESVDRKEWLTDFLKFLDTPWQEDKEIDIVSQLGEYRDRFEKNPSAAHDYAMRWAKTNKGALDRVLGIYTSDKFTDAFDKLFAESVLEKSGNNRDMSKMKEIMNNIRNIMMLKPDMPFVTVLYNALDSTDFRAFDDEDVLMKLQNYEKFLMDNK